MGPYKPLTKAQLRQLQRFATEQATCYVGQLEGIILDALRQCGERRYGLAEMYLRQGAEVIDLVRRQRPSEG